MKRLVSSLPVYDVEKVEMDNPNDSPLFYTLDEGKQEEVENNQLILGIDSENNKEIIFKVEKGEGHFILLPFNYDLVSPSVIDFYGSLFTEKTIASGLGENPISGDDEKEVSE